MLLELQQNSRVEKISALFKQLPDPADVTSCAQHEAIGGQTQFINAFIF